MRKLAGRLDQPHSFVQKVETMVRLDVFEYSLYCKALGVDGHKGLDLLKWPENC